MTRRGKIVGAGVALLLLVVAALGWRSGGLLSVTESTEHSSYYFRLKASYTHAGEPIDFEIVVACGIRVDRYRSGDSGFVASLYPRFFVHRTGDGHAVMQIVPAACRGQTTENGFVPNDFLPGVVWFDEPGDYRFGIAYVSEDAFENPNGLLDFHGASIEKATHAEWEAFIGRNMANDGMQRRYYVGASYSPEDARRIASGDGKEIEVAYARGCSGVLRYKLSDAAQAIVRKYWPVDKPRFWATDGRDSGPWPELLQLERKTLIFANGFRYIEHLNNGNHRRRGFPTRSGGGPSETSIKGRSRLKFSQCGMIGACHGYLGPMLRPRHF